MKTYTFTCTVDAETIEKAAEALSASLQEQSKEWIEEHLSIAEKKHAVTSWSAVDILNRLSFDPEGPEPDYDELDYSPAVIKIADEWLGKHEYHIEVDMIDQGWGIIDNYLEEDREKLQALIEKAKKKADKDNG